MDHPLRSTEPLEEVNLINSLPKGVTNGWRGLFLAMESRGAGGKSLAVAPAVVRERKPGPETGIDTQFCLHV